MKKYSIFDKFARTIDRIISGSLGKQILFFLFFAAIIFTLLFVLRALFFSYWPEYISGQHFWDTVYNFINSGGFEHLGAFERWFILITNLSGKVIFAGILVALFTNTIYQRIGRVKNGDVYYSFSGHIVIIGYEHICNELVGQLAKHNEVVLQTSHDVGAVRRELFYSLSDEQKRRVTIVNGNRVLHQDIEKLNIHKCKEVFLFGGIKDDAHDSKNIECLGIINGILAEAGKKIRCHVLFEDHSTFAVFQQQEIPGIRNNIDFIPFNFYDMWAQKVFVKNTYNNGDVTYKPLDHEPISADSQMRVHLVILGMSRMGIALGTQAAHICHFPNFITKGIKTRVTFIDETADTEMSALKLRLRSFFDEIDWSYQCFEENIKYDNKSEKEKFTDIEFEFIKASFESAAVQNYLEQAALEKTSFLTIAVALPVSSAALTAALYLPPAVYDSGASVLVRQEHSHAIVSMLSNEAEGNAYRKYKNLRPFGMFSKCYDITRTDDLLPMMIKYTYDNTSGEKTVRDFPEDIIRHNWINNWRPTDNLSALKASCRYAANFIPVKQRSLDIKESVELNTVQKNLAARMEHRRWVTEKLLVGFRAPTPEEAAGITREKREYFKARFIHEDIKGYDELGENVKIYDINISVALPYMIKE